MLHTQHLCLRFLLQLQQITTTKWLKATQACSRAGDQISKNGSHWTKSKTCIRLRSLWMLQERNSVTSLIFSCLLYVFALVLFLHLQSLQLMAASSLLLLSSSSLGHTQLYSELTPGSVAQ